MIIASSSRPCAFHNLHVLDYRSLPHFPVSSFVTSLAISDSNYRVLLAESSSQLGVGGLGQFIGNE
eukprot:scaffold126374_cov63-Attheya_sp.AAC.2